MDTIKKIANAILDAGEGCQSGLVYVDPVEAAKSAIAVLSAEERSYRAGFNDGWEAANGEPPEAALSTAAEPVAITILASEYKALRDALKPFAKYAGNPKHLKQRAFLQLLICPLGDDHPDNHMPYFQAALGALALGSAEDHTRG